MRRLSVKRLSVKRLSGVLFLGCGVLSGIASIGCSSSAQEFIALDLQLRGTRAETVDLEDGATIDLSAAELAFGPLYLCAGTQAGELCESARIEWLGSAVLDVLEEEPQTVGNLEGLSGSVRSWMYDHAFTSTRSAPKPIELSAATELGQNSVRLAGTVNRGAQVIPFQTEFPIRLSEDVEPGFPVVRSSTPLNLELIAETQRLELRFQTDTWLSALRLADFYQELDCDAKNQVSCQGTFEQRCDDSGVLLEEIDCTENEQICAPFAGCADVVDLPAGSRAVRALEQEIIAGTRPEFRVE